MPKTEQIKEVEYHKEMLDREKEWSQISGEDPFE